MLTRATKDLFEFAAGIDSAKEILTKKKHKEHFVLMYGFENIEPLALYYAFLADQGINAFEWEIETIEHYVGPLSENNAEKLKAMSSILKTDRVFTDIFAFNTMIEVFNNRPIIANTVESYSAEEIMWAAINIIAIFGANNFPFKGDALKYIRASLQYEGWELPPLFMAMPIIIDMFDKDKQHDFMKKVKHLQQFSLQDLSKLSDEEVVKSTQNIPYYSNYLLHVVQGSKYLNKKINNTLQHLKMFVK